MLLNMASEEDLNWIFKKRKNMSLLQKKSAKYNVSQSAKENGLYSYYYSFESGQDTEVIVNGEKTLMFGSNSYPGLINYPEIIKAAKKTLNKYGTGASGSRLMSGNIDLHNELENNLADFVSKPATTIFSTGFQVNYGYHTKSCGQKQFDCN